MKIYNNANLHRKHLNSVILKKEAKLKANKFKLPFGVITFEPVPVMFFNKKKKIAN